MPAVRSTAAFTLAAVLLTSCGRPDASGVYLAAADRQVTLVQLVESKEGNVTGRLEQVSIGADGAVSDRTTSVDGAASQHDLMFKPANAWLGGLAASGAFSGDHLTLTGTGFTLNAERADLATYQAAVAHLQSVATSERKEIADAQAARAASAAQQSAVRDFADKTSRLSAAAAQLQNDVSRLDTAVARSPDFGKRSAANTARIAAMLRVAPTLSDFNRSRLEVEANQVEVGTNQIDVARTQYGVELDGIVQDAAPLADQLVKFCASPQGARFSGPCATANSAAAAFRSSFAHAQSVFRGYKQAVQNELERQSAMIRRMGG